MPYKVFVDDNFHFMDQTERYELGEFPTLDAAIEAAKKLVDEFLHSAYRPGMTAQALFEGYTSYGEDPFIVAAPAKEIEILFSAWDYAKCRCNQLCNPVQDREAGC